MPLSTPVARCMFLSGYSTTLSFGARMSISGLTPSVAAPTRTAPKVFFCAHLRLSRWTHMTGMRRSRSASLEGEERHELIAGSFDIAHEGAF
jgi:hypothetical protein